MTAPDPSRWMTPRGVAGPDGEGFGPDDAERWLGALAGLGIGLRLLVYLLRPPIWTDEAKLAVSLLDRDYPGLLEPLAYSQIAPVLFLWMQKSATLVLGYSEYSLRLLPLAAAIASVLLMRRVCRQVHDGTPAVVSLALFSVSYYPVRHAAELKPYATDLLASLVLTALAVEWLRDGRSRWLWLLSLAAPVAIALSYPAIFVAAGALTALALAAWRERDRRAAAPLALGALLTALVFSLSYFLVGAAQRQARLATQAVWPGGFPPLDDPLAALGWLLQAHLGRTFGYPLGAENGGSLLTFTAFAVGAVVLVKAARWRLLALLLLPFAAGLGAAVLQRYPYGGSGRVSQYLVPAICLLAGLGATRLTALAASAAGRRRARAILLAGLVGFGVLLAAAVVVRPYRDRPDWVARGFARWLWESGSRDAVLVEAWEDLRLPFARPSGEWIPGGAGYRVNQRIYFERRRRGLAPDLESISAQRPLRVVFLASSVAGRQDELEDWLTEMQARYELAGQERYTLGRFAEQHGAGDELLVYSFVPRAPGSGRP